MNNILSTILLLNLNVLSYYGIRFINNQMNKMKKDEEKVEVLFTFFTRYLNSIFPTEHKETQTDETQTDLNNEMLKRFQDQYLLNKNNEECCPKTSSECCPKTSSECCQERSSECCLENSEPTTEETGTTDYYEDNEINQ